MAGMGGGKGKSFGNCGLRVAMVLLVLGLSVYTMAPALFWHFAGGNGDMLMKGMACRPCSCDCTPGAEADSGSIEFMAALAEGLNFTYADCLQDNPDMQEERGKSQVQLLKEELKLQKEVNEDAQKRAELAYLDAKNVALHHQKESEKCNMGMETSEEAREQAEAELVQERRKTLLWEQRAFKLGWTGKSDSHQDQITVGVNGKTSSL